MSFEKNLKTQSN